MAEQIMESGIGMTAVARKVGVAHPAISRWISGRRVPNPQSCIKVARFFNVPEEYVLELAGHKTMAAEEPDIGDPELRGFAKRLGELDERDSEIIKAQLRVMLGRTSGRGRRG